MAIETDFIQFLNKPSGVYRLTKDKSQISTVASSPVTPLIIGFSKKGMFNTPVFCADTDTFEAIYGSIDRTLERKGSFFHRAATEALTVGPVIALNLYNLKSDEPADLSVATLTDPNYDLTEYKAMSVGSSFISKEKKKNVFSRFFNTDKFWFADPDKLNTFASLGQTDALLSFVNVGQKPTTILVKKSKVTGFNVTLLEWFGADEMPEYLSGNDYVEDYFIDIIVLSGDYTNYGTLSIDPVFGKYFTSTGLKSSLLTQFLSLAQVTTLGSYTGCLIPDFIDKTGKVLAIDSLVNQDTSRNGVVCALNQDYLEQNGVDASGLQLDMIGHNLYGFYQKYLDDNANDVVDFASYKGKVVTTDKYNSLGINETNAYFSVTGTSDEIVKLTIPSTTSSSGYIKLYNAIVAGSIKKGAKVTFNLIDSATATAVVQLEVTDAKKVGSNAIVTFEKPDWSAYGLGTGIEAELLPYSDLINGFDEITFASYFAITGATYNNVTLTIPSNATEAEFIQIRTRAQNEELNAGDWFDVRLIDTITPAGPTAYSLTIQSYVFDGSGNLVITFDTIDYTGLGFDPAGTTVQANPGAWKFYINGYLLNQENKPWVEFTNVITPGTASNEVVLNSVSFGVESRSKMRVGSYVLSTYDDSTFTSRLTRIKKITNIGTLSAPLFKVEAEDVIFVTPGNKVVYTETSLFEDVFNTYDLTSLFGFRIKDRMMPDNTGTRMNEIYGVINSTNLGNTLIDKRAITFRYIVDTFNHGLEASSKSILTSLAKRRENAFAILNAPKMKEFSESTDPIFTDLPTSSNPAPNVNTSYIVDGGNLQNNPTFRYSLPSESDGSAYGAFYAPNVLVKERGKVFSVPPAIYVVKNFVAKHTNYRPWSIIAGTTRGVISGSNVVGLDYQFDDTDRGYLENFGINTIVFESGAGLTITSNSTAKQSVKTSLSQINGTEVLIYIQDRVAAILKKYVWEFNTPEIRLEVKTIVDQELDQVKIDGGIYDYVNVMNAKNNTGETIDNLLGIIDSHIEVTKGLAKAIHRTTIHKTGQIATGII